MVNEWLLHSFPFFVLKSYAFIKNNVSLYKKYAALCCNAATLAANAPEV